MAKRAQRADLDLGDVLEYLRSIETTYDATVKIWVGTDGARYARTGYMTAHASVPHFEQAGRAMEFEEITNWPTIKAKTLEGVMYYLLTLLDRQIGDRLYKQQQLPF